MSVWIFLYLMYFLLIAAYVALKQIDKDCVKVYICTYCV